MAGIIAAIAIHPQIVLLLMAYTYLASGLIGVVISSARVRPPGGETEAIPAALRARPLSLLTTPRSAASS